MTHMAKKIPAIEYVIEVSGEDAKRLAKDLVDPEPNPAAERLWERAKKLNIRLEEL